MRNTVIFDMDGTVLDTIEDLLNAMNAALTFYGYPTHTLAEMKTFVGNGLRMMAVRAVPAGTDDEAVERVFRHFKQYYSEHLNINTRPYPGITDLLRTLKAKGIATAINSNKFDAGAKLLAQVHFGDLIDITYGESEATPKKPDPAAARRIMEALGTDTAHTIYVGDSRVDIETARNAGLKCICVGWGFQSPDRLTDADWIAHSIEELQQLLTVNLL